MPIAAFFLIAVSLNVSAQDVDQKLLHVFNKGNKNVLIAAHRGDWRNAPENSLQALQNCIAKGYDIVELDVRMTKDKELVVMHDNSIYRTTNGKGNVSDYTLAELKTFRLKNGIGMATVHQIPTLKEMMTAAKGKIIVNVDKGDGWLPQVFDILNATNTVNQSIVNVPGNTVYQRIKESKTVPENAFIMVVVGMKNDNALAIIDSYKENDHAIVQPIFDTDTITSLKKLPEIAKSQVLWLNSLWASLNGGHDDDTAVELNRPEESWGWLIKLKPMVLQTDRLVELSSYLRAKKLRR